MMEEWADNLSRHPELLQPRMGSAGSHVTLSGTTRHPVRDDTSPCQGRHVTLSGTTRHPVRDDTSPCQGRHVGGKRRKMKQRSFQSAGEV
ncbi:hypothetical protein NHX12_011265 [Muraenolepis orangiensis]|uniref:Uncharacterized protein n=1 Tax=Muraenolepis orangiensis TaxID=630683 RepID=A0A9Q0I7G9_9TELE|nr:hypothetical protein NHX12_011265 [Muraenolepis orangiensis]